MYKVLLVDDEELDLKGMQQFIPWSELGMEVRGAVNNALSACEVLNREQIDILVSDINMPYMSGLELAKIAQERSPHIRIIFVSGYQEFSYVQQALSLKAYSYVLKPMEDRELITSLLKIKQDLDNESKQREVEEVYQHLMPIAKSDMLIRLLEGVRLGADEALSKMFPAHELKLLQYPVRIAVLEIDTITTIRKEVAIPDQELCKLIHDHVHEVAKECGITYYCKLSTRRIALVLEEYKRESCLLALKNRLNVKEAASISIGLGEPVEKFEKWPASYQQAIEAIEGKMFLGRGTVIKYEDISCEPELLDAKRLEEHMTAMLQAMSNYELVLIYDEFEKLFQSISNLRSKYSVHHLTSYVIWKLEQYLHSIGEDFFQLLEIEPQKMEVLQAFETVHDIRVWLLHRVYEISEQLHKKNHNEHSKFIRNVRSVIKDRMSENITLKDIAHVFSFSPSYLGFLIKEKSGYTFNELLVDLRMERACELLKEPGLKIYEIADQVGYRYLPYFSRQFKDRFGLTPLEFRKKVQ